jgi:hypothetical protein
MEQGKYNININGTRDFNFPEDPEGTKMCHLDTFMELAGVVARHHFDNITTSPRIPSRPVMSLEATYIGDDRVNEDQIAQAIARDLSSHQVMQPNGDIIVDVQSIGKPTRLR